MALISEILEESKFLKLSNLVDWPLIQTLTREPSWGGNSPINMVHRGGASLLMLIPLHALSLLQDSKQSSNSDVSEGEHTRFVVVRMKSSTTIDWENKTKMKCINWTTGTQRLSQSRDACEICQHCQGCFLCVRSDRNKMQFLRVIAIQHLKQKVS